MMLPFYVLQHRGYFSNKTGGFFHSRVARVANFAATKPTPAAYIHSGVTAITLKLV